MKIGCLLISVMLWFGLVNAADARWRGYPRGFYGGSFAFGGPGFYPGFGFGYGFDYPFYPPYYAYPPVIRIVPETPPVYVQRGESTPLVANFWYYCRNPAGYYPSVQTCPGGWYPVAPLPQNR